MEWDFWNPGYIDWDPVKMPRTMGIFSKADTDSMHFLRPPENPCLIFKLKNSLKQITFVCFCEPSVASENGTPTPPAPGGGGSNQPAGSQPAAQTSPL